MSETKKNNVVTATEPVVEGKSKEMQTLVYVGPTIPGVASHGMLFNNGISDTLKAAMEKESAFKGLVVPTQSLATALLDLQNKKGATWALYNKVVDYKL